MTNKKNPYRDYRVEHLYEYLGGASVGFPPGTGVAYSNLGAGLLGHVLALRAGLPYDELLAARILRPLGLTDTAIALSADQASRLAPGHAATGEPTSNWDLPTLAGAGALRSTADELLIFLRANLDPPGTPAGAALAPARYPPGGLAEADRVGIAQAVGLAAASLLVQWAVPVSPGRWTFLAALILPVLVAEGWKGFWSGVWTAVAVWAGSWLLWGSGFGWAPAGVALLISLAVSGHAAGYLPPGGRVRLGWQEAEAGPGVLALWHNGGTGGYRSFVGFVPGSRVGVVVLSNSANDVDPIGMALLKALDEASSFQAADTTA